MDYIASPSVNKKWQPTEYDTVVIYHAGCADGLAAAKAFSHAHEYGRDFGTVYYHYTFERDFHKDKSMPNLVGKHVFIVDYSYPRNVLVHIRSQALSLTILDHHKTAASDLAEPIPDVISVFDMDRCGAEITWDYLYGVEARPWWLIHIRDRDLWEWKDGNSHAFSAAFTDLGMSFETLDTIHALQGFERNDFYTRGKLITEFQNKEVESLCNFAELVEFEGYAVYALNSPRYRSETGNVLALRPNCKFSFVYRYCIDRDEWWVSLRGISENKIDLGLLAKKYGGGGHPNASGFAYRGNIQGILKPIKKEFSNGST